MTKEDIIKEINNRISEHEDCKAHAEEALAINDYTPHDELLRGTILVNGSAIAILKDLKGWIEKNGN